MPTKFFAGWGTGARENFRRGHSGKLMLLFVMRIDEPDRRMMKRGELIGRQDDVGRRRGDGQKWCGAGDDADDKAKKRGEKKSHGVTVEVGERDVEFYIRWQRQRPWGEARPRNLTNRKFS